MKKLKRQVISMILAALMILTSVPTAAFGAVEDLPVPIAGDLEETENGDASAEEPSSEDEPEPEESLQEEGEQEDAVQKTEEEVPEAAADGLEHQTPAAAQEVTVGAGKANVRMSMKQGDTFFYLPKTSEIPSNLAKSYGFTYGPNVSEGDITPLDALVQMHIDLYDVTKENIGDYLEVNSAGFITKLNGVSTSSISFAVNGAMPHDDVETDYGYTGYSANDCVLRQDDEVEFFFYQDDYYLDNYGMFFADGEKVSSIEAEAGEDISLQLKGYCYAYFGNYAQSMIDQQTKAVEDAQLMLITPDAADPKGYLGTSEAVEGAVTDAGGSVTFQFDTAGTYYVSAKCDEEYDTPLVAPYLTVTVKEAAGVTLPELDAEWYDYRSSPDNMAITQALTPTASTETHLKWGKKIGADFGWKAVSSPILVDGYMYCYFDGSLLKINKETGDVVATGTMAGSSNFSIVPPTYGGGMIFVGLSNGRIQAFNASTLESLWVYKDELGGQPNSPIRYSDGYIYTGFWNSETKDANFVCVKADARKTETKTAKWTQTIAGGVYWAGAYATDQYVLVGTDDGQNNYTSDTASLYSFDKETGEVISRVSGFVGDIRTDIAYDAATDRVYFASKGGYLYSAKVSESGTIDESSVTSFALGGMSTSTPLIYNGRVYIGVSGASNFSPDGHSIKVLDLAADGTAAEAYTIPLTAYPQSSALLTTAYESDGYVYAYFTVNSKNGEIYVVKDKPGLTEADPGSGVLYTPEDGMKNYCITSAICDSEGTIYYKNDSGYMMALEKAVMPTIETTLEDGMVQRGSKKTFDVIARDGDGNKIDATVKFDGKNVEFNWNDDVKTSYTLNFSGKENGDHTVEITVADGDGRTAKKTCTINYQKAEKVVLICYATMGIEATTINSGYIIEPVKIPVYEGDNAAQALTRLILANGYDYSNTGTVDSGFYLSSIIGANARNPKSATKDLILDASLNEDLKDLGISWTEGTEGQLGEFDYAQGSGWMYCLNNVFPNVGFADSYLSDGDVVRVQFTVAYGSDIGGGGATGGDSGKIRADKDDLSEQIAAVNSAQNRETLLGDSAIKSAYDDANAVMLNLPASQEEVNEAYEALKNAVSGDAPTSMEMDEKEITLANMSSKKLNVTYTPEDIKVPIMLTWTSSDSSVAKVAADGTVTAAGVGKATITAEGAGMKAICEVTVPEVTMTGIAFSERNVTIARAEERTLSVLYTPENTTDPRDEKWSSSDPAIVAVQSDGSILGISAGTATITVTVGEFTASCEVTVAEVPITGIDSGQSTDLKVQVGKTLGLSYSVLPENTTEDKTATAISTNPNIVQVTNNKTIKGVSEGEADVIVRIGKESISYHVSVEKINATDFNFSNPPKTLNINKSVTASLSFQPVNAPDNRDEVQWSTSDPAVVSLEGTQGYRMKITGKSAGTATITAALGDISRSFDVTVLDIPITGITLTEETVDAYVGKYNSSVRVIVSPSNTTASTSVKWTSSDTGILEVTGSSMYGSFTAKKAGTVNLTAEVGEFSATCVVNVHEVPAVESIALNKDKLQLGIGKSSSLSVQAAPFTSDYDSKRLKWSSSDETVATVSSYGSVKAVGEGTATITATYDERLTAVCEVTAAVIPVESVYFKEESTTIQGLEKSGWLSFSTSPADHTDVLTVSAESSDSSIVTVESASTSNVTVKSRGAGSAVITLTVKTKDGSSHTASTEVIVDENFIEAVAFPQAVYEIAKGANKNFLYEIIKWPASGDTGSITWNSSNQDVATVSSSGSVKAVGFGETTITAELKNKNVYSCKVEVPNPVTDVTISASRIGMLKGSSISLDTIDFTPADGNMSKFSWASSNTDVLTVKNGIVKAVGVGSASIYGTAGNAFATCEITVTLSGDEVAGIEVIGLIDQIGEVTLDSEDVIKTARTAYNKLTRMQKAYVENDQKLFDAEDKLYELQEVMRSPVTLSSVKSVNYNTVNVTWKSVNGAEGYQVYRKTAGGSYKEIAAVSGRETTAYRDTGLTTGTAYTYTVRAVYTLGGEKQLGDYVKSGITGKAMPEKTVISKVQSWGSQTLKLTWEKVSGASGYQIYHRTSQNGPWKYVTQIADGNTTSYMHYNLICGNTYDYVVRAYRTVKNTKYIGANSDILSGKPVPAQVKNVTVRKASSTSLKISWSKVNGASGYQIYRRNPETGKYQFVTQLGNGNTAAYTEKGLKKGITYTYVVRAYRTVNGNKILGANSTETKGSIN